MNLDPLYCLLLVEIIYGALVLLRFRVLERGGKLRFESSLRALSIWVSLAAFALSEFLNIGILFASVVTLDAAYTIHRLISIGCLIISSAFALVGRGPGRMLLFISSGIMALLLLLFFPSLPLR